MAEATKHITASMRKTCEGCGDKGRTTNRGLCKECSHESRKIKKAEQRRRRLGRTALPPYFCKRHAQRSGHCKECGETFHYTPHLGHTILNVVRSYCSRQCQKRSSDRVKARARRAKVKGALVSSVNYNKVFERDAWRCGLCGRKTNKNKRGTQHSLAPVVDHIIPLSKGGEHTYRNVQCACHECNSVKGADIVGQLRLF